MVLLLTAGLFLTFSSVASADTVGQVPQDPSFTYSLFAWAMPLGIALVAIGLSDASRARRVVNALPLALAIALLAYTLCGYAFQFGGVGLISDNPGLEGLVAEWSPLDRRLGPGWGLVGLKGFLFSPRASTGAQRVFFVSQLAFLTTAVLIPLITLYERVRGPMRVFLSLLAACLCYPLMGNWVYGGGWLSQLGETLGWGQGFIDQGLASTHLVGGGLALAGLVAFRRQAPEEDDEGEPQLPVSHLPLHLLVGSLLAFGGWITALLSFPLAAIPASPWILFLNALWGVAGAIFASLFYGWFVRGEADPGLTARGILAGQIAVSAGLTLFSSWEAALVGFVSGLLLAPMMYLVEHVWGLEDPGATVSLHGFCALGGIVAAGLAGSSAAGRMQQLYAQLVGVGALLTLSFLLPGALLLLIVRLQTLPEELQERARERALALEQERSARERLRQQGLSLNLWQRMRMGYLHVVAAPARRLARRSRLSTRGKSPSSPSRAHSLREH
jgi:Amt family ammonium transporter